MSESKDIDYLFISAQIRSMETNLLTKEQMERMIDARSLDDSVKILSECGYGDFSDLSIKEVEKRLQSARLNMYDDLYSNVPDVNIIDVFRMKFDYHNIKVILKSDFSEEVSERLLVDCGRVPLKELKEAMAQMNLQNLPAGMSAAVASARESLALTKDPQVSDFILDNACYEDMMEAAEASGSSFLVGYVKIIIDSINLRSAVRLMRRNKDLNFARTVLLSGGNVSVENILSAISAGGNFEALFSYGELKEASEVGSGIVKGGRMTEFEKLCDNAVMDYLSGSKYAPFGAEVLIGYIYAKEAEFSAIRIILTGRISGLEPDIIRERLREAYV